MLCISHIYTTRTSYVNGHRKRVRWTIIIAYSAGRYIVGIIEVQGSRRSTDKMRYSKHGFAVTIIITIHQDTTLWL